MNIFNIIQLGIIAIAVAGLILFIAGTVQRKKNGKDD